MLLAVLLPVLSGCGIETIVVLEPPTAAIATGTDKFMFRATNANNETEFLGFEVYYRIFAESGDSVPGYFTGFEEMRAGQFQRLYDSQWAPGASGFTKPLIAPDHADHGKEYTITIDFNANADIYPQVTSEGLTAPPGEINILAARRSIATPSEYKRFDQSAFVSGEADLTSAAYASIANAQNVRVVMFAVSYGFDTNRATELYSQPVLIGDESLTIKDYPY